MNTFEINDPDYQKNKPFYDSLRIPMNRKLEKAVAIVDVVTNSAKQIGSQLRKIPGNPKKKLFKPRDRRRGKKKMRILALVNIAISAALGASQIFIIQSQPIRKTEP